MPSFSLPRGHVFQRNFGQKFTKVPEVDFSFGSRQTSGARLSTSANLGRRKEVTEKSLYLYLEEKSYAETWIGGGYIPLNLASTYLDSARKGTKTPDELRQHQVVGMDENDMVGALHFQDVRDVTFTGCVINGQKYDYVSVNSYKEDAYILCLSFGLSKYLLNKFEKKTCVKIDNLPCLMACLNEQLGSNAEYGPVTYTQSTTRDHFTKNQEDAWQAEYRLVWPTKNSELQWVNIPAGLASLIDPSVFKDSS